MSHIAAQATRYLSDGQTNTDFGNDVWEVLRGEAFRAIANEKALPFEMRVPNKLTAETLTKSDSGEDVHHAKDAEDLFGQLGI